MADRTPRLFAKVVPEPAQEVTLGSSELRHARVLRLRTGSQVTLFDGAGAEAQATVLTTTQSSLVCVTRSRQQIPPPLRRLTLLVGMTKGDKPDLVVRMTTELGVSALRLVTCARSVVRGGAGEDRLRRLQHIAIEACAQSGNPYVPQIVGPQPLVEAAALAPASARRLVYWEDAHQPLASVPEHVTDVWAIVGPEGGLDVQEVSSLSSLGYVPVALRTPILRAETAAVTIAARLLERLGES